MNTIKANIRIFVTAKNRTVTGVVPMSFSGDGNLLFVRQKSWKRYLKTKRQLNKVALTDNWLDYVHHDCTYYNSNLKRFGYNERVESVIIAPKTQGAAKLCGHIGESFITLNSSDVCDPLNTYYAN